MGIGNRLYPLVNHSNFITMYIREKGNNHLEVVRSGSPKEKEATITKFQMDEAQIDIHHPQTFTFSEVEVIYKNLKALQDGSKN